MFMCQSVTLLNTCRASVFHSDPQCQVMLHVGLLFFVCPCPNEDNSLLYILFSNVLFLQSLCSWHYHFKQYISCNQS